MKAAVASFLATVLVLGTSLAAHAELGWTIDQYAQQFGPGERGYGKVHEIGYQIGASRLVVEFRDERSIAEVWLLGVARTDVPPKVMADAEAARRGHLVKREEFKARSAIPAEIYEAILGGVVVRVDVRNQLVNRVAFCGRVPPCAWWRRVVGRCPSAYPCDILDRILQLDHTVDRLQAGAEEVAP